MGIVREVPEWALCGISEALCKHMPVMEHPLLICCLLLPGIIATDLRCMALMRRS